MYSTRITTVGFDLIFPTSPKVTVLEKPVMGEEGVLMVRKPSPNRGKAMKINAVIAKLRITRPVDHPSKAEPGISFFPVALKSIGGLLLPARSTIKV